VVLSFYNAYADALSAAPLAYKHNAPILLTHSDYLTGITKEEIKRLKATNIIIVGGTGSISTKVENDLKAIGIKAENIKRFGGKDRFEVAKNIADQFPTSSKAIIAYGLNFSDALAIAPYASRNGFPILLTRQDSIPTETVQALNNPSIKSTLVIGGEGSVGKEVYSKLKSPTRIGGKDRFEVAANIVNQLGYTSTKAYLATGLTFADALTGSVLAAKNNVPILLSHPTRTEASIQSVIFDKKMFEITILGGTASVPQQIVEQLISYRLATVNADGLLTINPTNYSDISQVPVKNSNQVAVFGNEIVKMTSGMVVGAPSYGNSTTTIYTGSNLVTSLTYVSPGSEMKYLEANATSVKVQVADKVGWVKQSEVNLVSPVTMYKERSYYTTNSSGDLVHVVRNVATIVGKAPSFIAVNQKYYSWDGFTFYDSSNKHIGTSKQYFQYLSTRSKTNYTRDQLLSYITNNPDISVWEKREGRTSPLRDPNLIDAIINAQNTYHVNALLILAAAIHESAWGVSDIAAATNNLFGIKAYDSNPSQSAEKFASYEASVNAFATTYMSSASSYADPKSWKYNGTVPGHKGTGINVRYASDPNWGSRVAGHMYRADKYLGSKEFGVYNIVETKSSFNVRQDSTTNSTSLYYYPKAGIPVTIIGEVQKDDGKWYKIITDYGPVREGYIRYDGLNLN
jgi:putative cell wall-binding protein/beta-N-acetylglucosaminidase